MKIEEIKNWNDLTLYLNSTNLSENSLLDIINAEAIKTDSFKNILFILKVILITQQLMLTTQQLL